MCRKFRYLLLFLMLVFSCPTYSVVPQQYLGKPLAKTLAIASLTKVINSGRLSKQTRAQYYQDRGMQYANLGRHLDAIRDYSEALAIDLLSSEYYVKRAISFARLEQYQDAFSDLSLAEKINPNKAIIYSVRGGINFYLRRYKQAADDFRKYVILKPADVYRKLWLHLSQKQLNNAAKSTLQKFKVNTKLLPWPAAIVDLYVGEISPESLLQALELKIKKSSARLRCEAFFYLGHYYLLKNNPKEAQRFFQQSVKTGASNLIEYEFSKVYISSQGLATK